MEEEATSSGLLDNLHTKRLDLGFLNDHSDLVA